MATNDKGRTPVGNPFNRPIQATVVEDDASKSTSLKFNTDKTVNLNDPKPFTGKFLRDVALHIAINDHIFTNDIKKIAFVLSYMTEGDVAS